MARIDQIAESVGSSQSFPGLLDALLNVVIIASDSTIVTLRTKALRALGQIVANNPEILKNVSSSLLLAQNFRSFADKSSPCN